MTLFIKNLGTSIDNYFFVKWLVGGDLVGLWWRKCYFTLFFWLREAIWQVFSFFIFLERIWSAFRGVENFRGGLGLGWV